MSRFKFKKFKIVVSITCICLVLMGNNLAQTPRKTVVTIQGDQFFINGKPTYEGRTWQGYKIEGLLMNSRMVQGIFDDANPATVSNWIYPDTKKWDPERNTNEFVKAMDDWYAKGLLAFTFNLQGGSPLGYGNKGWVNTAIDPKGNLKPDYMQRLEKILNRADELGMVVILGIFYFGQDEYIESEAAVVKAVDNVLEWLFDKGYKNVLIEVNNETSIGYDHEILRPGRVHELILQVRAKEKGGYRYLVGTSYKGCEIPLENVVANSDFILLHGNGVEDPAEIPQMVEKTKSVKGYKTMPILFNEDDHFNFDQPMNNMVEAVKSYASWGYFDYRMKGEGFQEGYQSIPVDWQINSKRKTEFFKKLEEITGGFETK